MKNMGNIIAGILAIVWIFVFPIGFFVYRSKLKQTQAELESSKEIASGVTDGNAYAQSKKEQADQYYESIRKQADEEKAAADQRFRELQAECEKLQVEQKHLRTELATLESDVLVGMVRIDAYDEMRSDEVKNQLALIRNRQDDMVRAGTALVVSNGSSKKIVNSQIKQILRCFNAECSSIISGVTAKNIDASRTKIQRSFDAINKIFEVDGVQLSPDYLSVKFEELSAVYAYMLKIEEEKEQKRAIREQMLEEEKVRKEIERQKKKIDHDRQQFTQEVQRLMGYMQKTGSDVEKQIYVDKIRELEDRIKELEADEKTVLERENNAKAGFVYIISNIGSFGEQVFKIGMTRRLEPMDRIAELSSASVPFPFDVHAMIFSDDAPALEALLHRHFDACKVNKVNPRKEFFRVSLDEIKKLVLSEFNGTAQFVDTPAAEEYRETLRIEAETENR